MEQRIWKIAFFPLILAVAYSSDTNNRLTCILNGNFSIGNHLNFHLYPIVSQNRNSPNLNASRRVVYLTRMQPMVNPGATWTAASLVTPFQRHPNHILTQKELRRIFSSNRKPTDQPTLSKYTNSTLLWIIYPTIFCELKLVTQIRPVMKCPFKVNLAFQTMEMQILQSTRPIWQIVSIWLSPEKILTSKCKNMPILFFN